jgi:type I restriction enzyme M protein
MSRRSFPLLTASRTCRLCPARIAGGDRHPANDWNLNIRRYVDNSPPPEPHDVRAHMLGGVPVAELEAKRALFDALGLPRTAFKARTDDAAYWLNPRSPTPPIRTPVENDAGGRQAQAPGRYPAAWRAAPGALVDFPHSATSTRRTEF